MLPFMKLPVVLPGPDFNPKDESAQQKPDQETEAWILPGEIESFHPGYYWGTMIYMKSGQVYITKIEAKSIEGNISRYWEHVMKIAGKSQSPIVTL